MRNLESKLSNFFVISMILTNYSSINYKHISSLKRPENGSSRAGQNQRLCEKSP
jgi:hypothetical protein